MTPLDKEERELRIKALQEKANQSGETSGWFEPLYADALRGELQVPWDDGGANPHLLAWLQREGVDGTGKRALEVGCGTGDGAMALAGLGFEVDAVDLSASAIELAKARNPHAGIRYAQQDMLAPPQEFQGAFDLVVEIYTLQAIQPPLRKILTGALPSLVAPGGLLLMVARARDPEVEAEGPPWPLTESEVRELASGKSPLTLQRLERFQDDENPSKDRFRALFVNDRD